MSITATRSQRRQLERDNARLPVKLQEIPRDQWPDPGRMVNRVFRSRDFLVQEYMAESPVFVRLSINRTSLKGDRWDDNITWDELQRIKNECGYAEFDAVEVFPPADDVVNVANMRHLWVLIDRLPFAWRKP